MSILSLKFNPALNETKYFNFSRSIFHLNINLTVFLSQSNLVYILHQENKKKQEPDIAAADTVLPIAFDDVAKYINTEGIRNYLFPYKRILVDMVPYKLMESNTIRMQEISGEHTRVFSDVTDGYGGANGILSFGTLFKAQKVSYVYGIEIYGTDIDSIKKAYN